MCANEILRWSSAMILTLAAASARAGPYGGGTGEPNNPYLIYTAEQMNTIGVEPNDWASHFKLMADIDLAAYTGTQFHVIGRGSGRNGKEFRGVFDGNGHTISNFTYSSADSLGVGLFASLTGPNAEIKNLGLISPRIVDPCMACVGALACGVSNGTITNCYVRGGSITSGYIAGGLVGDLSGMIDRCYVEDCTIDGVKYVGGLVGCHQGLIANCCVTGSVIGDLRVGGLAGETMLATIVNCYASVAVSGDTRVGGLVGYNRFTDIRDCYSIGPVTGSRMVGGLVGEETDANFVTGSFWDTRTSGQTTSASGEGKTTAELQDPATFAAAGWPFYGLSGDPSAIWAMSPDTRYPILWWQVEESQRPPLPAFAGGAGTANDAYLISTATQLNSIAHNPRLMAAHFQLANDIDLQGIEFFCLGDQATPFTGVFEGDNKVIANFVHNSVGKDRIGLFRCVRGKTAQIRNLRLLSPCVEARGRYTGSLVGHLWLGTVANCHVEVGVVSAGLWVGGLVGKNDWGAVMDCSAAARVVGGTDVGGLLGDEYGGRTTSCHSTSEVRGYSSVGGLAGSVTGPVTSCFATGPVTGTRVVGGLVGNGMGEITGCYATGDVRGETDIGGLAGCSFDPISRCYATGQIFGQEETGGLVGSSLADVDDCHATGAVTGVTRVGGLLGYQRTGTVQDSYATGAVSGSDQVGGLAGYNEDKWSYIVSCFAAGAVAGKSQIGGLVGRNRGTIRDCHASGGVSGQENVGGLVGRNGEVMEAHWFPQEFPGIVTNCYSTGHISDATAAGGLIGLHDCGSVTASFWDKETSGQTTNDGGQGKTTAEMQTAGTYLAVGWDLEAETGSITDATWWIREGLDYPHLSWEPRPEQP